MIRSILILSLFLLSLLGFGQTKAQDFKIFVKVVNVVSDKGKVHFALYNSQKNFNERNSVATKVGLIKKGVSKVEFTNVLPGTYAIICYHDANDNGKMDFAINGMPIKDYGMTNNIMNFGPPLFDDGKFKLTNTNLSFTIKFQ